MKNTFILLTLALFASLNITGCSLFSSGGDEKETATVADDQGQAAGGDEFASDDFESGDDQDAEFNPDEVAKDDGGFDSPDEMATQDVEVEDSFGEDNYPDDDYATGGATAGSVTTAEVADDFLDDNSFGSAESETLAVDEGGLPDSTMSANQEEDLFGQESGPVVDTPVFSDAFSGVMDSDPVGDTPQLIGVKRMKPAAYKRAGANINRLYVVRPNDSMDSIAQKLYGSDRTADLYSYNSHFQGKSLKVGDKVYYESPNNQNDQAMMTYYEDNNISPQYYTSQDGDNLRKISKQLLGHERSWMEVYATNENVESKDRLPAGLQIRYWPDDGVPAPMPIAAKPQESNPVMSPEPEEETIAMNDQEPMEMGEPEEVKMDEVAQVEEAKPMEDGMNSGNEDFSPPPTAGSMNEPPRPIAPPPPPPAPRANFNKPEVPAVADSQMPLSGLGEDSTIMAALGGLLILAFIIMLIFIRRSRAKRVNFSQTQV